MSFSDVLVVSKLPGLYKLHKHRSDGLILKSLQDDKVFFAASRAHSFTPLDNITIYTTEEPVKIIDVMLKIYEHKAKVKVPNPKADASELKEFLTAIIPNYDDSKVYVSDIQKIVKWYHLLESQNLITPAVNESEIPSELGAVVEDETSTSELLEKSSKAKATKKVKSKE